ncbi:MAG: hypothetical protein HQK62_15300, partial [Desulfamplus sp.]|nr:hypothetical protein [Desulfamplus sp.]
MTAIAMVKPHITEDKSRKEEVFETLKEQKVEFILAQFVDIHGAPRVKQVPLDSFDDIVEDGAGFAGAAVWGMGMGPESHDLMARTDLETYRQLPWQSNVALASADLYVDGQPWPYCPRNNLKRMLGIMAEKGYTLNGGFEPEHFLVTYDNKGRL